MALKNLAYILIFGVFCFSLDAQSAHGLNTVTSRKSKNQVAIQDTLSWSISFLKKIFNAPGEWHANNESFRKPFKAVVDYAENEPIDSAVFFMDNLLLNDSISLFYSRKPENISNRKNIPGFLTTEELDKQLETRKKVVTDSISRILIQVPETYLSEGLSKIQLIPSGDPQQLIPEIEKSMPASFRARFYKGWANIKLPSDVSVAEADTLRNRLFNWTRKMYNDSILILHRDSLIRQFRADFTEQIATEEISRKRNFLMSRNREILNAFNDTDTRKVNDSIRIALQYLTARAANDSVLISLTNLTGTQTKIWTAAHPMLPMRIFLKNEQNDSIGVILYNNGKGGLRMVLGDGVKFSQITTTEKKEILFNPKKPDSNLRKVNLRQIDPLPWKLLGTGTVGFTQTSLSNWAKGGESSLSMLLIGRYTANYSKKHLKWENLAEFRIGIFSSKTRGLEKNDDKLEFQSRFGYSAFKKWFYSGESNFRTQIARGYKFPDKVNPISTFMAPAYLTFSVGMDYKPNKNFSLFISPLTSKTTFVLDTALIDPTHFGLESNKNRLWEPGAIVKLNYHLLILENVVYDTRAEIFNNYRFPFRKFNLDWEQTLVMQVTRHISTRIMSQLIYDYNVKFPVTDDAGKVIDNKAKWQFKELFTVGFNYKF